MNIKWLSCVEKGCGIGEYSDQMVVELLHQNQTSTLYRKGTPSTYAIDYPHRSLRGLKDYIAPYYLYKQLKKIDSEDTILHADNIDAFTAIHWSQKKTKIKCVTIHDVIPLIYPQKNQWQRRYYNYQLKSSILHSDQIFTVSHYSKNDLIAKTGVNEKKVKVIYNGINHDQLKPVKNKKENERFTIRYIGGLGAVHKNATALIEVAKILEEKNIDFLMQIGSGNAALTPLPSLVEKYNLKNIEFVGYVKDEDKASFLGQADCFLFTSLYEGFGFPPLEAMACGTPVVSSNAASLNEILHDAAMLTSASPLDLANNIIRLIESKDLQKELVEKGIERASHFTWENSVKTLRENYDSIL
ncbi:glycosyltransferase family 4 protein [Flammeovirga agarivorans]|uniref:Glycosyltransferase family 4 protein n=1 Tax=Flammeovirga agarivorans TaxID=2726742 RepID=A0A7X8SQN2_9BACT|nr:glycosyltransferase family 1 protein [Flammeovirga agarivorans]NLR94585.1 glycosyltransferase family 4 protein [Flammeovirga agarivorans]